MIAQYSDKKGVSSVKEYLSSHITKLSYRDLFEQLRFELNCKSFERMYEKIGYDFSNYYSYTSNIFYLFDDFTYTQSKSSKSTFIEGIFAQAEKRGKRDAEYAGSHSAG